MANLILKVQDLSIAVAVDNKLIVDHISFDVGEKRILSLVGGSGSGKTTIGMSILGLLSPALRINSGKVYFNEQDLLMLAQRDLRTLRGNDIAMIFQEPLYAFNPLFRINEQIEEVLALHTNLNRKQRQVRILELLSLVGVPDPKRIAQSYPHQLSGGLRQRAMIAQAICAEPKLIIADEPTSNLDVTLQAMVMDVFRRLRESLNLSIILITHDLGMVKHLADDVVVLTQGQIVEKGQVKDVLANPQHEFTQRLLEVLV